MQKNFFVCAVNAHEGLITECAKTACKQKLISSRSFNNKFAWHGQPRTNAEFRSHEWNGMTQCLFLAVIERTIHTECSFSENVLVERSRYGPSCNATYRSYITKVDSGRIKFEMRNTYPTPYLLVSSISLYELLVSLYCNSF